MNARNFIQSVNKQKTFRHKMPASISLKIEEIIAVIEKRPTCCIFFHSIKINLQLSISEFNSMMSQMDMIYINDISIKIFLILYFHKHYCMHWRSVTKNEHKKFCFIAISFLHLFFIDQKKYLQYTRKAKKSEKIAMLSML